MGGVSALFSRLVNETSEFISRFRFHAPCTPRTNTASMGTAVDAGMQVAHTPFLERLTVEQSLPDALDLVDEADTVGQIEGFPALRFWGRELERLLRSDELLRSPEIGNLKQLALARAEFSMMFSVHRTTQKSRNTNSNQSCQGRNLVLVRGRVPYYFKGWGANVDP